MTAMSTSGLTDSTVKKLAALARLALDDAEVRALVPELARIVSHVDQMRAVDTTGVTPMTHGHPEGAVLQGSADDDSADNESDVAVLGRAAVAGSAGFDADDGTVLVPRVIE